MLPTPSTAHISFDSIYEPAEDSFLLIDCIASEEEKAFLKSRFKSSSWTAISDPCPVLIEIGAGSGVVVAFATANAEVIFGRSDFISLGTDVNGLACRAAQETATRAVTERHPQAEVNTESRNHIAQLSSSSIFLDCLMADLCSPLRSAMVDVLLFNPPYVPTPHLPLPHFNMEYHASQGRERTFEENSHLLELSYAGGHHGMEVTNRVLDQLPYLLNPERGVAYILLCAQNQPELVKERVRGWGGSWQADTAASSGRHGGWEKLQVIRIWRAQK